MKRFPFLFLLLGTKVHAQIPVTDLANLANNEIEHVENISKWVESIAQLRAQIEQLDKQIAIQGDLRAWAGNPKEAGAKLTLEALGEKDLLRTYGRAKDEVLAFTGSLESLKDTGKGTYRAISDLDLDGRAPSFDEATFRRYSVLGAKQANAEAVAAETSERARELQEDIAATVADLKIAETEAEVQKQSAKLAALTGQLAHLETERKRQVDEVVLQKVANDARLEEERLATAQLEASDATLVNQRITAYMKTLSLRKAARE